MLIAIALSAGALAATWTVDPAGGGDFTAIGAAISASADGDRIEIAAGEYDECLDTAGTSLTLVGAGAASTSIAPTGGCDAAVAVYGGESVALEALTITNPGARGIYVYYSALALTGVTVTGSGRSDWDGGGLYAYGAVLDTVDCALTDNTALSGGAIYLYGYDDWTDSGSTLSGNTAVGGGGAVAAVWDDDVVLQGTVMTGNTAETGGAYVGSWYTRFSLDGGAITDNVAAGGYGGGLYFYAVSNPVTISDSEISRNTATLDGGGISLWWYADLTLDGVALVDNVSEDDAGGLLYYPGDSSNYALSILDSEIRGNQAALSAGGVYAAWHRTGLVSGSRFVDNSAGWSNSGGGLLIYVVEEWETNNSTFCGNSGGYGGGASAQWIDVEDWRNNQFVLNSAHQGGGLYRYYSYGAVTANNTFVGNAADEGGAYLANYGYSEFVNNAVVWTASGNGIYARDPYSYSYSPVTYGGWYENAVIDAGGYFYVADGLDGNLVTDPGFVDWTAAAGCDGDLRLAAGSGLRDAGDPEILDPDGSRSDVGAYGGPGAPIEDRDGDGFDTTSDCVDSDPAINPEAIEVCSPAGAPALDDDCDGAADDADPEGAADAVTWYTDADGDGYGGAAVTACLQPSGTVASGGDCDDADASVHPGATEVPDDGIDDDCDGADEITELDSGGPGDSGLDGDTGGSGEEPEGCGCAARPGGFGGIWWLALVWVIGVRERVREGDAGSGS